MAIGIHGLYEKQSLWARGYFVSTIGMDENIIKRYVKHQLIFGPVVYPILGYVLGHAYPESPTFGLPCPTTIFTIGALLLANESPKHIAIIPLLWSGIGFMAAISLGVKEDVSLLIAGLIGTIDTISDQKKTISKSDNRTTKTI